MKKCKYPVAALAVMALCASCSDEVPAIPDSELYTREWVKNFGAINPSQDWNAATRGSVSVSTDAPARVRITADIKGCNYLLADYKDVSGSRNLVFDIPKGVKEVTVICGSERNRVPLGGSVSFASSGRIVPGTGSTEITAELVTDPDKWMVVPMLNATMFRSKLPEGCYNPDKEGVHFDFTLKFTQNDIIVRPLYWQTSQTLSFGFFRLDENGQPVHYPVYDMEKTKDYSEDLVLSYVPAPTKSVVIEDFMNNAVFRGLMEAQGVEFITAKDKWDINKQAEVASLTATDNFEGKCSADDDGKMTRACRAYLESEGYVNSKDAAEDRRYNYVYRWRMTGDNVIQTAYPDRVYEYATLDYKKDLEIIFTYFAVDMSEAKAFGTDNNMLGEMGGVQMSGQTAMKKFEDFGYPALVSKGIKVHIEDISKTYGGYIKCGENYFYSMSDLNKGVRWVPKPGATRTELFDDYNSGRKVWKYKPEDFMIEEGEKAFRAAAWTGTKYGWNYMSFEDGVIPTETYNASSCDFDMQDFVFIIDNFTPSGGTPVEIVPDNPVDQPIKWLIACEDLGGTDDFDFNDVVFEVEHVAGTCKATITPLAAGGTLPIYLMRDGARVDGREWHMLFGDGNIPYTEMINTRSNSVKAEPIVIDVPEDFTITSPSEVYDQDNNEAYINSMGGFYLMVDDGSNRTVTPPVRKKDAEAPQMILIYQPEGKPWRWPKERIAIDAAFPGFKEWMQTGVFDASVEGGNWSETHAGEHLVIKR